MAAMSQQPPDAAPPAPSDAPAPRLPWSRRYRLLLQLGALAALAAVLGVLIWLTAFGDDPPTFEEQSMQERATRGSIINLIEFIQDVPPADLPESFEAIGGISFSITLLEADLGAATELADLVTSHAVGWGDAAEPIASGVLVEPDQDSDLLVDAMRTLRTAPPESTINYVFPTRELVDFTLFPDPAIGEESFHFRLRTTEPASVRDGLPDLLSDVIWVREGRLLFYVTRNAFARDGQEIGPAPGGLALEIDLVAWARDIHTAYLAALQRQEIEEGRREALEAAEGG